MPILHLEPSVFPPQLLAEDDYAAAFEGHGWYVLHTKPRQEKSLARELYQRQIPYYLPLVPRRNRIGGRILTSYVPLFSGYVFLLANREKYLAALTTSRVVRSLQVPDQRRLFDDLRQVCRLIEAKDSVLLEGALTPGVPVEIISGPLAGLKGKIVRSRSVSRFVVEVDFLRQGVSVEVDEASLQTMA